MEKSVNRAGSACHRKQTIVRFFFVEKKPRSQNSCCTLVHWGASL